MFKALTKFFASKPKAPRLFIPVPGAATAQGRTAPAPAPEPEPWVPPPTVPTTPSQWEPSAIQATLPGATPEDRCGITPAMNPEEIKARLAKLYQRHNRAASSFDPRLREEAEQMLETLAGLRDKYFGSPAAP